MEGIKVEPDESLDQKVNISELQSDIVIEQTTEHEAQEKLNCYNESFLTERNSESPPRIEGNSSSATWEWTNGEFPTKLKEEVNDEDQFSNVLFKEERESVDVPDNKDIFYPNEMIVWSDDVESCELSPIFGMRYSEEDGIRDINQQSVSKMKDNAKRKGQIVEQRRDKIEYIANCRSRLNTLDDNVQVIVNSNVCDESDERFDLEEKTQVQVQVGGKILECSFCNYITADKVDYLNHGKGMHDQFFCSGCTFSTPLEFCLKRHTFIEHPIVKPTPKVPKNYKCDKCSFTATSTGRIEKHSRKVHIKKNKCELCDFRASSKGQVEVHRDAVHLKLKNFECHLCDFKTSRKSSLIVHVDGVHLKRKIFGCHSCDFSTARSEVLKKHVDMIHLRMKNFKCEICDFRTGTKYRLKLHTESVHSEKEGYQCKLCSFRANLRYELKVHERSEHSELKTFKCPTCERIVLTKLDLEIHVNSVHLKLKKYKCDYCDFETSRKKYLKPHVDSVHLNRKRFKCNFCVFHTGKKYDLKIHNDAVHLKLKNFKCESCDFRTSRKSTLNTHIRHCLSKN